MAHENDWVADKIQGESSAWSQKEWSGLTSFGGNYVWTDGTDIYYSSSSKQYVLDKETSTWRTKTWSGLTSFGGNNVWTDGENVYYSLSSTQYVLNKATSTWSKKTWSGLTNFNGGRIWTDGTDIYYSSGSSQYVLDKATSTWRTKTWSGLTSFQGSMIWTDGENTYYSNDSSQYVLDKETSTWRTKTWSGLTSFYGSAVWNDGENVYYSSDYVLDKETSTWRTKTWSGLTSFVGEYVWTDGIDIYYSDASTQYCLKKPTSIPYRLNFPELKESIDPHNSWLMDDDIPYRLNFPELKESIDPHNSWLMDDDIPYRMDFPELKESLDIDSWVTHKIPDPSTAGLRFLKLSYNLTVNWEGNGTNNITVSTDIPEAFKVPNHLYISSSMSYHEVWMVINTEIPQCPYQCRMTFDDGAVELLDSLNFIGPRFYVFRSSGASAQLAFNPSALEEDLYSESIKNTGLRDDRQYLSSPYNYACEARVVFNHGSGGAFPQTPGTVNVAVDIIFAFDASQTDRYNDLLSRYPDHVTSFEYTKNAVPYRPAFPEIVESIDITDKWLISDDIPYRWNFPKLIESSANPVRPPSYFIFKGKSSAEFGSIEILPLCLKHEEKTDFINFIYGNPYVSETSILRSKVITITLNLSDISPANIDRVNEWLIGTGKLVLSHDPHRYYIATCNNALTGQKLVNTLGKVAVQFNVMPYKYDLKEKDSFEPADLAEEMLHKTAAIYYKGSAPAESTFKITATGNIEIYNVQTEKTVEIKGLTEYCIIDIKARKVTDESNLNILNRTYGDIFDLMLVPGYNYFFLSGSVTAVEVKKKTRWY